MFHAVRRWWREREGRRLAGLFAFEFVVVMAGVLAAQGLQGWVAQRSEDAEGRALLAEAMDDAEVLDEVLNYWRERGPCLQQHVGNIARTAASGGTMTAQEIGRPALPQAHASQWDDGEREKVGRLIDQRRLESLDGLRGYAATTLEFSQIIGNEWATFRLLDPALGEPSEQDRSRVRQAAVIVDNRLRWLLFARNPVLAQHRRAEVPVSANLPATASLADECGLLKDWR